MYISKDPTVHAERVTASPPLALPDMTGSVDVFFSFFFCELALQGKMPADVADGHVLYRHCMHMDVAPACERER